MLNQPSSDNKLYTFSGKITRITALWAFSEAAFGGILHALRIPFTGLFIGGAAVIFISLIAYYSNKSTTILKSTLLVVLIKFIISPYTPINAYFSVFVEAILGTILFGILKHYGLASFLLGIVSLIFSAFQKLLVITLLFGNTIWESINIFGNYIINLFITSNEISVSFSYILIGLYLFLHFSGGIIAGITAGRIPKWINNFSGNIDFDKIIPDENFKSNKEKRNRKPWFKKKSGILLIIIAIALVILSYFSNEFESNLPLNILVMFIRSIVITILWFLLITPIATKFLQKYLNNKKSVHSIDLENIVELLPYMKAVVNYSWRCSKTAKGFSKIKTFFSYIFVIILNK